MTNASYMGDLFSLETADGRVLEMPDAERVVQVFGDFGMPDIRWITSQGYRQHGQTEIDYLLEPRELTLGFYHVGLAKRDDYWTLRQELIDLVRPNRGGLMTLTVRFPDGRLRAISVRANPGFRFPVGDMNRNNWSIQEALEFLAHDPVWFDPDQVFMSSGGTDSADFVFPIEFPVTFGISGRAFSWDVEYAGNWPSYPIFTLHGPYDIASIENRATGISVVLTTPILAGDVRVIDLTPGAQRVYDEDGASKFNELDPTSNLVDFNIRPDPEVPGGVQEIRVSLQGSTTGVSSVAMQYNTRFVGV